MSSEFRSHVYGTRRNALIFGLWCVLFCHAANGSAQTPAATILRIGIVTPVTPLTPAQRSTIAGIRLGAAEAEQTARLFGADVKLFEASGDGRNRGAIPAAAFLSSGRKVQVLIAVAGADVDSVARFAEDHHLIAVDIATRSLAARRACRRYSFHVEASEVMYLNAARQFATGARVRRAGTSAAASDSVALWDSHLQRYGASQLNDRYAAAAKREMDGAAWAGWTAIKIASEAALRAGSAEPARMLAYLEAPTTQFDGHKGWPLSFRPSDHQLRQPLYIVVPTRSAASAPRLIDVPDLRSISTAGADAATVDALDRLSAGSAVHCAWRAR